MSTIMNPDPALPTEIAELVLLHLPAVMLDHQRQLDPSSDPHLSIAKWTWWAYCILPSGLSTTSLRRSALKFTHAADIDTWEPLVVLAKRPNKSVPAKRLIQVLIRWYSVTGEMSHVIAAYDCAVIHNRVRVLVLWQWMAGAGWLPERASVPLQLPFIRALDKESFHAVAWIHDNIDYGDFDPENFVGIFAIYLCMKGDADMLEDFVGVFGGFCMFERIVGSAILGSMVRYATERQADKILNLLEAWL